MNYRYLPVIFFIIALTFSYYSGYTPLVIPALFIVASLLAYRAYRKDKLAALNDEWRVAESTLHLYALLCGWPGAIIAQQRLRHKTRKRDFRLVFWLTLLMNLSAFSWLHTDNGSLFLHDYSYKIEKLLMRNIAHTKLSETVLFLTKFHKDIRGSR